MDNPDLQSILSDLARYSTPTQQQNDQNNDIPNLSGLSQPHPNQSSTPQPEDPRLKPQSRSAATASPKPVIDPATITTWQEGLRCVTKIASQNSQFAAIIRKMMQDQRNNELRWYNSRQNLKHTQAKRAGSSAQAQSILASISSGARSTTPTDEPSKSAGANGSGQMDSEAELAAFDRRIYEAQREMEIGMVTELKGLGVPFFGTDQSLVAANGVGADKVSESRPKWSSLVTETELLELRRKMVQHLEDLYRD